MRYISIDISAALLQGLPLSEAKTKAGAQRKVWCKPPRTVWDVLRKLKEEVMKHIASCVTVKGLVQDWNNVAAQAIAIVG